MRAKSPGRPPPLPHCHLCGRQFGTTSLGIHMKACKERWEREHPGKVAPEPAKPIPTGTPFGGREWAAFNEAANDKFNNETLEPCPHCGRTFLPERLAVHLRTCGRGHFSNPKSRSTGDGGGDAGVEFNLGASARERASAPPKPFNPSPPSPPDADRPPEGRRSSSPRKGMPPRLPNCHLCGRQFGTTSLGIHMKACKERWEREHGRPAPMPDTPAPLGAPASSREWAAFNEAAIDQFNTETLQPCPHCGRTFLPDRLAVHLRTCGRGHFASPKQRGGGGADLDIDAGASDGVAFPSPEQSVMSSKLGALARQRGGASGSSAEYFEDTRANRAVRDTSAEAIKQRQAACSPAGRMARPGSASARASSPRGAMPARAASPRREANVAPSRLPVPSSPGRGSSSRPATARAAASVPREPSPRRVQFADRGGGGASAAASEKGASSGGPTRPPLQRGSSRERLSELGELLRDSFITKEEYESKRKAILDAI